jgi:hypothetical protein
VLNLKGLEEAMSTPKKPKKPKGDKTHPPAGPPLMEDIPTPKMHERPHSPAAADPPEGETQPVAANYGKAKPSEH